MSWKNLLSKLLLLAVCIPLIALSVYCGMRIHNMAAERESIKKDYSEINSIENGLLSVDAWKGEIEQIAAHRIEDFDLTPSERKNLEAEITSVLRGMILKTDTLLRKPSHSIKGKIGTMAYKAFVNKNDVMKKAPGYSHAIVNEMLKPNNKEKIKNLTEEILEKYAAQTHGDSADTAHINKMLLKYNSPNLNDFNTRSKERTHALKEHTYRLTFVMLGIIALFLLAWLIITRLPALQKLFYFLSVVLALTVLLVGLTSPMIEIDARIQNIDFVVIGEHLQFKDQVIFYQSKSILQVVKVLIETKAVDSTIVGILILTFSIVFPITKLIATQIHLLGKEKLRKNKFISFFALKSGKWSMADVMVVAIFMAYVGFKGILDNELKNADFNTPSLHSISTNLTSLQPAFLLFLGFVLYGLILSEILKRIEKRKSLSKI